jgi:yeast amino acid transporter
VFLKGQWDTADFVTNYLPLMLFPVLYIGAKLWTRVPIVRADEMDFVTDLDKIEAETYDEPPPRNKWEALWQWLVRLSLSFCSNPGR